MGLNWWQEKTIEHGVAIDVLDAQVLTANETIAILSPLVSANITAISSLTAALAESTKLQVNSAMSKAVMRRKGYFDITPTAANKRVMFVGIPIQDGYYYPQHDLLSRGIPFHVCTFTQFLANYATDAWKTAYDIMFIGGKYDDTLDPTVTPTDIKTAVQAVITGSFYKIIQVGYLGMQKTGQTVAYWHADLGVDVWGDGSTKSTNFTVADTIVADTANGDVVSDDVVYSVLGYCSNAYGTALTRLAYATGNTAHWFAATNAAKSLTYISIQAGTITGFNVAIDIGKLIWHIRGIKSHPCFNRIDGKKYIAWGWDCDRTISIDAINNIIDISGDRPIELALVTSKITDSAASFYRNLQYQDIDLVSHSRTHFNSTIPEYSEWSESINDLDELGLVNNGILYLTGTYNKSELFAIPLDAGYLLCGYLVGYEGRQAAYLPIGEYSGILGTSYKLGRGCIVWQSSIGSDDIANMGTNGINAYDAFVAKFNANDIYPYSIPLIFYFHDSPSDITYNGSTGQWTGTYYDSANGIERRLQFYRDVFAFLDTKGYTYIKRSTAMELIYDFTNCVSMTSETIAAGSVTAKVVSSRHIKGATIALPTDDTKTIATVKIEGITIAITLWERSADNKWIYVGIDLAAGYEHTILVTYA
jgi:hypothetical protein